MNPQVQNWLARDPDPGTRAVVEQWVANGDDKSIDDAFSGRLSFGTAGLRGVLGAGPMHMNRLVVRETTAGLAAYVRGSVTDASRRGVVVGYDGRVLSKEFAEDVACVLAGCGIRAYVFTVPQPTPLCAFAVAQLGAAAGVVVTASHNPRQYNGYKVYGENGAQIVEPHDAEIALEIEKAAHLPIPWCERVLAEDHGLIAPIHPSLIERYLNGVAALSQHPRTQSRSRLGIAYTPLHGVGAVLAEEVLRRAGFTNVRTVTAQRQPDGRFPTIRFPNPEEPGTMDAVLALAGEMQADLAIANDPDADRFAVAVRRPDGSFRMLSGNEIGALLGWDCMNAAPANALVITSIVSSRLLGVMARARGVAYTETLTGFKWIANEALARGAHGAHFIFGYEEAYGYTVGELVRDKDGISALLVFAELAAALADRGESILDLLERIEREYGLYLTGQRSLALDGNNVDGARLRAAPPVAVGGRAVRAVIDLLHHERNRGPSSTSPQMNLPPSDVIIYELEGDARITVRPSGTEPKIKCYYELRETVDPAESMSTAEARGRGALGALIDAHQAFLAIG